jgi:hypothetical protein
MRNSFPKVSIGLRNATRTPALVKIHLTFSETPLTEGRHVEPRISYSAFLFV